MFREESAEVPMLAVELTTGLFMREYTVAGELSLKIGTRDRASRDWQEMSLRQPTIGQRTSDLDKSRLSPERSGVHDPLLSVQEAPGASDKTLRIDLFNKLFFTMFQEWSQDAFFAVPSAH